ncbi:hypothetical protein [Natronoglomus mannanivorans]|uniref:Uncharacterized protein n=1 Tax=Natronoglomus mannanivorans TaxID=2979990 RepID=A0AAP2Z033_9EURY|nr:hypothetical protein [Halobacteria archaeon AArc-xg1-1]
MDKTDSDWENWKSLFDLNFSVSMERQMETKKGNLMNEHGPKSSSPALNKTIDSGLSFELFQTPGPGPKAEIGDIWHLPFIGYKRLPRYLAGLTLLRNQKAIKQDHHEYWRATGAFASQYVTLNRGADHSEIEPPALGDLNVDIVRDLCLLLQLLELRTIGKSRERLYMSHRKKSSPTTLDYIWTRLGTYTYQISSVYSSAVLEGLLRRRSSVLTSSGLLKEDDNISKNKKERAKELMNGNRAFIFDALRLWLEFDASDSTKRTIVEIEDLANFKHTPSDSSILSQYLTEGELPDQIPADSLATTKEIDKQIEEIIPKKDGFFFNLRDIRNRAAHREEFIRSMCAVITSVACLVFWDSVSRTTFDKLKNTIDLMNTQSRNSNHPYPLFSDRKSSDFTPDCFYGPWLKSLY